MAAVWNFFRAAFIRGFATGSMWASAESLLGLAQTGFGSLSEMQIFPWSAETVQGCAICAGVLRAGA
jgi:hypothetical protein